MICPAVFVCVLPAPQAGFACARLLSMEHIYLVLSVLSTISADMFLPRTTHESMRLRQKLHNQYVIRLQDGQIVWLSKVIKSLQHGIMRIWRVSSGCNLYFVPIIRRQLSGFLSDICAHELADHEAYVQVPYQMQLNKYQTEQERRQQQMKQQKQLPRRSSA